MQESTLHVLPVDRRRRWLLVLALGLLLLLSLAGSIWYSLHIAESELKDVLAEADRLLSTGEGFDPLLYEEGNDTAMMDTGAIRRVLGLDCSR